MRRSRMQRRRFRYRQPQRQYLEESEMESSDSEAEGEMMRCVSCQEEYDAATCKECYEEANETKEELKREIDDLKAKVAFLRFCSPLDSSLQGPPRFHRSPCFSDVVLVASHDHDASLSSPSPAVPIPAHKAVLVSRSPVFRAMLENEMEESRSGTIKISDASYEALHAFVNYLYTAEVCLDEQMACDLLVLAEKYQVKHLKTYCERFLVSILKWENSVMIYAFAQQHNAKHMREAALSMITDNMDKLTRREEYLELKAKDPRLVVEIYEAYLSKQVNTAAHEDCCQKT